MQLKTILSVALMSISSISIAQTSADWQSMNIDAHTWTKNVKMGWNLGNSFESRSGDWDDITGNYINIKQLDRNEWETEWGNPKTTKAMLTAVKEAGFDAVRIPVLWGAHITDNSNYTIDSKWLDRVQDVVDMCMQLDMKVIINTHHEYWLEYHPIYNRQTANNNKLKAIWTQVANRFKDYDARLAFAGVNEVQVNWQAPTSENNAVMNSYNQTFVDAVRATGGNNAKRNLIVQTYSCSPEYGLSGLIIHNDQTNNRLSVEFHYYSPYNYAGNCTYYYWGTAFQNKGRIAPETEANLQSLFKRCKEKWYDKGLGVIIGEYGVACHYTEDGRKDQLENERYYTKMVTSEAKKNGFASFVWDNNAFGNGAEKFGIFDRYHNMAVKASEVLNGIQEGSGAEVIDYSDTKKSQVYWEGNSLLSYGNGLQLTIPAIEFADFTTSSKLVLVLKQTLSASYSQLQIYYSDWSNKATCKEGSKTFEGQIDLRQNYGNTENTIEINLTFDATTISKLKQLGLVLQGFGAYLNKVVIDNKGSYTNIKAPYTSPLKSISPLTYDLSGKKVKSASKGKIYIQNGKKYIAQ